MITSINLKKNLMTAKIVINQRWFTVFYTFFSL